MEGRAASFSLSRDLIDKEFLDFSTGDMPPNIQGMQAAVKAKGAQYPGPGYIDGGFCGAEWVLRRSFGARLRWRRRRGRMGVGCAIRLIGCLIVRGCGCSRDGDGEGGEVEGGCWTVVEGVLVDWSDGEGFGLFLHL